MSLEEVANAEVLRRIREAEDSGATSLDLSKIFFLHELLQKLRPAKILDRSNYWQLIDLSPLARLTLLQTLNLTCWQLTDFSPLTKLTSLQTLDLSDCEQLTDLSPLARLTSLQTLDLSDCEQL